MDKTTKFVLAFALAFLAVLIGIGIGNRALIKSLEPLSLPDSPRVSDKPQEQKQTIKSSVSKIKRTKIAKPAIQEKVADEVYMPPEEQVSPAVGSVAFQPDSEMKFPLLPGSDSKVSPEYLQNAYPQTGSLAGEFSAEGEPVPEGQEAWLPKDNVPFVPLPPPQAIMFPEEKPLSLEEPAAEESY